MQTQITKKEVQERFKFSEAKVRKLLKGNRRYYRVDSEVVGFAECIEGDCNNGYGTFNGTNGFGLE